MDKNLENSEKNSVLRQSSKQPTDEFLYFLSLSYEDLVQALKNKYEKMGLVINEPYFNQKDNGEITKNNKIVQSQYGLEVHHVAENKFLSLSSPKNAKEHDMKYQQPEYLVYANQLEHALLHAKIIVEYDGVKENGKQVGEGGLFTFLIPLMNDYFSNWIPTKKNEKIKLKVIENNFGDLMMLVKYLATNNKLDERLYTSYNSKFDLWDNIKNIRLYHIYERLGAPYFSGEVLRKNDSRMKQNQMVQSQGRIDKIEQKPHWARHLGLGAWVIVWIIICVVLGLNIVSI